MDLGETAGERSGGAGPLSPLPGLNDRLCFGTGIDEGVDEKDVFSLQFG